VLAQRYQRIRAIFGTGSLFTKQRAKSKINQDVGSLRSGHAGSIAALLGHGAPARYALGTGGHYKGLKDRVKSSD